MVREDLSWDEVARLAVHSPELPGVVLDSGLLRDYPHGAMLAHVLGYVGAVNAAEQAEDGSAAAAARVPHRQERHRAQLRRALRGRAGLSRVEVNAIGREIRELDRREGEPGDDLRLGLDLELQRYCVARLLRPSSRPAPSSSTCEPAGCWRWPPCRASTRRRSPAACGRASGASCATTRARRWSTNASAASTRRARPSR